MSAAEDRRRGSVAIRNFVETFDQITCLLEFNRKEVSGRDVDSLQVNTLLISAAGGDLVGPKRETARVRFAIKEIQVMLPHEESGGVDRVRYVHCFVVGDSDGRHRWRADRSIDWIAQTDRKSLRPFGIT